MTTRKRARNTERKAPALPFEPHDFAASGVPGVCRHCPLPKTNRLHAPQEGTADTNAERRAWDARRLGERED